MPGSGLSTGDSLTADPDSVVNVDDLKKTYRSYTWRGRKHVQAVRGVSLQAQRGEVFGLLGPNGAGKTTLIKMLLGVIRPSAGKATVLGQSIGSPIARSRVGYLPESLRVDRHHTARSALRYYGRLSRMDAKSIAKRSDELLELVGLQGRDREPVVRFSKGMYQRLGLAQALLHNPDLLVLDEPTDGLDPVGRNEVRRVIERLRDAGKTIFLNSHILQEVELVCSRVAIMAAGQLKAVGPIDQLANQGQHRVTIDVLPVASPDMIAHSNASAPELSANAEQPLQLVDQQGQLLDLTDFPELHLSRQRAAVRLAMEYESQAQIDLLVDRLRQAGCSIVGLSTAGESLEQTFMRLVGPEDENNSPVEDAPRDQESADDQPVTPSQAAQEAGK
jgi:ABC-2 type transport system ATP-binding protein